MQCRRAADAGDPADGRSSGPLLEAPVGLPLRRLDTARMRSGDLFCCDPERARQDVQGAWRREAVERPLPGRVQAAATQRRHIKEAPSSLRVHIYIYVQGRH